MVLSSILGGLTGLVGSGLTAFGNYKLKKLSISELELSNKFELAKLDKANEHLLANTQAKISQYEAQAKGKSQEIDSTAFLTAVKSDTKIHSNYGDKLIAKLFDVEGMWKHLSIPSGIFLTILFTWIEVLRKVMRPGITIVYTAMMFYVAYKYYEFIKLADLMTETAMAQSLLLIIDTITYVATSSSLYWIGSRANEKLTDRLLGGDSPNNRLKSK